MKTNEILPIVVLVGVALGTTYVVTKLLKLDGEKKSNSSGGCPPGYVGSFGLSNCYGNSKSVSKKNY